jgi:hypothetical protein
MTRGIEAGLLFLLVCFALGVSGALLGAWVFLRTTRAQLEAQRDAFELAREQAQRDLQQTLLCVPQWIQQAVRIELEFLGRQEAERHKAQFREQQRWQSGQDEQRLAEWSTLMSASASRPVNKASAAASRPERPMPMPTPAPVSLLARPPELMDTPRPQPAPVCAPQEPERELSDEEIDALPPDLPAPTRLQGRKLPAPKKPVLRDI